MSVLMQVAISVTSAVVGAGVWRIASTIWARTSERRRWRLVVPDQLRICISSSADVETGSYRRPTTGLGQAKALALISPSLVRAWRSVDVQNVATPDQMRGDDYEADLILLGGPKTNALTKDALEQLQDRFGVTQVDSAITLATEGTVYEGDVDGEHSDYGLVIRTSSPFASAAEPRRIVILCGSHTYGTVGAARWFVEAKLPRGDFSAIIKTNVREQHALPPELVWMSDAVSDS